MNFFFRFFVYNYPNKIFIIIFILLQLKMLNIRPFSLVTLSEILLNFPNRATTTTICPKLQIATTTKRRN